MVNNEFNIPFTVRLKESIKFRMVSYFSSEDKPGRFKVFLQRHLSGLLQDTVFYFPLIRPVSFNGYEKSGGYDLWCQSRENQAESEHKIVHRKQKPLFSIIVPVCDPEPEWLNMCIHSVLSQTYSGWEMILSDDTSRNQEIKKMLARFEKSDRRIHVKKLKKRSGISVATNHGAKSARADYLFFLDHDDVLPPYALSLFAKQIIKNNKKDIGILYADEDRFDQNLIRINPGFKPAFSPDRLLATNYIHHPLVIKKELFDAAKGFDSSFDGSQDHDLLLKAVEINDRTCHIPDILYHMRIHDRSLASGPEAKPDAHRKDVALIEKTLERRGIDGIVDGTVCGFPGYNRIVRKIKTPASITVIVLKTGRDNEDQPDQPWAGCEYLSAVPGKSHGHTLNLLAREAGGDILVFADKDLSPDPDWKTHLVPHVLRDSIGLVTGKLVYDDNRLHSCGLAGGMTGTFGRWHHDLNADDPGYGGWMAIDHEVMAVPRQFMAVQRKLFFASGMFNKHFSSMGYDIELALRLTQQMNVRHLAVPGCRLVFKKKYEKTPCETWTENDRVLLKQLWGKTIEKGDPYLNPNISLMDEGVRFKPVNPL